MEQLTLKYTKFADPYLPKKVIGNFDYFRQGYEPNAAQSLNYHFSFLISSTPLCM